MDEEFSASKQTYFQKDALFGGMSIVVNKLAAGFLKGAPYVIYPLNPLPLASLSPCFSFPPAAQLLTEATGFHDSAGCRVSAWSTCSFGLAAFPAGRFTNLKHRKWQGRKGP